MFTKISSENLRPYLNAIPAALITFSLGSGIGWVAPAFVHFTEEKCTFQVSTTDISWIASMYYAMEISSPILAGLCSKKIGRKTVLMIGAVFITLSWIATAFAESALMVIVARGLLGTSAGFHDITWSIYVGEFSKPKQRGIIGSLMTAALIGGTVFELSLCLIVSYQMFAIIPLVISIIALLSSFFLVESPQFLLMQNKEKEALANFIWFRGENNEQVQQEFAEIKQYLEEEKNTSSRSIAHFIKSPSEYKVYIVCVMVFGFMQFTGNTTITAFLGYIIEKYENITTTDDIVFLYGLIQFIFINISPFIVERAGRRFLLMTGFILSGLVQAVLALVLYVDEYHALALSYTPQILIALFYIIGAIFSIVLFPGLYVIKSELFPQDLKTGLSVASTFSNATIQFIFMKLFLPIWGLYGVFLNFAIHSFFFFFITIVIYIVLPETRGKTLIDIQKHISQSQNNSKRPSLVEITEKSHQMLNERNLQQNTEK